MAVGKRGGWGWKVPRFGMETSALSPSNIRTFLHQPLRFPLKCPNDPLKRVVRKWRFSERSAVCCPTMAFPTPYLCPEKGGNQPRKGVAKILHTPRFPCLVVPVPSGFPPRPSGESPASSRSVPRVPFTDVPQDTFPLFGKPSKKVRQPFLRTAVLSSVCCRFR